MTGDYTSHGARQAHLLAASRLGHEAEDDAVLAKQPPEIGGHLQLDYCLAATTIDLHLHVLRDFPVDYGLHRWESQRSRQLRKKSCAVAACVRGRAAPPLFGGGRGGRR